MFAGAWVIIIGAVIACTSGTVAQLTVARFILGAGISIMTVAAPAYAIEIAPAHWRGRCTGKHILDYNPTEDTSSNTWS